MADKIDYMCVDCGNEWPVSNSAHIDKMIYIECDCGELMLEKSSFSDDYNENMAALNEKK